MEAVKGLKRAAWVILTDAQVQSLDGRTLTLAFTRPGNQRALSNGANREYLQDALKSVLGVDLDVVGVVVGEASESATRDRSVAAAAPAYAGFAPGDEAEPEDPDAPQPERTVAGEDAALKLVTEQLGGQVLGTAGG